MGLTHSMDALRIHGKRKIAAEFNCRLICKQRVSSAACANTVHAYACKPAGLGCAPVFVDNPVQRRTLVWRYLPMCETAYPYRNLSTRGFANAELVGPS